MLTIGKDDDDGEKKSLQKNNVTTAKIIIFFQNEHLKFQDIRMAVAG